jgi:hypothetical protein
MVALCQYSTRSSSSAHLHQLEAMIMKMLDHGRSAIDDDILVRRIELSRFKRSTHHDPFFSTCQILPLIVLGA